MSVRNMIHGIKGVKLGSRSRRVVDQDGSLEGAAAEDGLKQSSWAQIPQELLREVLLRIEASESVWPMRKHVVFCAGVCRSWRAITKELVKTPEVSGRLTFPISVKQPGPRESLLYCFIKRNRSTQTYYLYLGLTQALAEDGKFLLSARKCRRATCTDYVILLHADGILKGANTYIGKLRSNFLGTKFTVYDGQPPHAGARMSKSRSIKLTGSPQLLPRALGTDHPVAHISYELNVLGSRGPRKMECVIDSIPASAIEPGGTAPTQTEFHPNTQHASLSFPFLRSRSNRVEGPLSGPLPTARKDGALVLRNKAPRWQEQLQCWCLNFHGRVTVASVKNFQLVASSEHEHGRVMLQFGKVGKNMFTMDYRYPISAFQAFAICLSSFDTKIACER